MVKPLALGGIQAKMLYIDRLSRHKLSPTVSKVRVALVHVFKLFLPRPLGRAKQSLRIRDFGTVLCP